MDTRNNDEFGNRYMSPSLARALWVGGGLCGPVGFVILSCSEFVTRTHHLEGSHLWIWLLFMFAMTESAGLILSLSVWYKLRR
jgi:hypothetical protein